jgi:superfamily II DNA or RNA helicase
VRKIMKKKKKKKKKREQSEQKKKRKKKKKKKKKIKLSFPGRYPRCVTKQEICNARERNTNHILIFSKNKTPKSVGCNLLNHSPLSLSAKPKRKRNETLKKGNSEFKLQVQDQGNNFSCRMSSVLMPCVANRNLFPQMSANSESDLDSEQGKAVKAAVDELCRSPRAQIVMATGTGKTRVGALIANELCKRKKTSTNARFVCVVLVPRGDLVSQTAESWAKSMPQPFDYACAGASGHHGRNASEAIEAIPEGELASGERPRRIGDMATVAGAVQTIRLWMKQNANSQRLFVAFSTYHSLGCLSAFDSLDLCIFDEAHRTVSAVESTWEDDEHGKNLFQAALWDRQSVTVDGKAEPLPAISMRLFLTATRRVGGEHGMNVETTYGRRVYELSFAKALKLELICPLEVKLKIIRWADVVKFGLDKNADKDTFKAAAILIATNRLLEKYDCSRAIISCAGTAEAELVANGGDLLSPVRKALRNRERYLCVTEKTTSAARKEIIKQLESDTNERIVCSNVRIFGEGIDVPRLDAAIIARKMDSVIDIVQLVGRVVRRREHKTTGFVFVPVYVDENEKPNDCVKEILHTLSQVIFDLTDGAAEVAQTVRQRPARLAKSAAVAEASSTNNSASLGHPPLADVGSEHCNPIASAIVGDSDDGENSNNSDEKHVVAEEKDAATFASGRDEQGVNEQDQHPQQHHQQSDNQLDDKEDEEQVYNQKDEDDKDLQYPDEASIAKVAASFVDVDSLTGSRLMFFEVLQLDEKLALVEAPCEMLAPALFGRKWFCAFIKFCLPMESQEDKDARSRWLSRQNSRKQLSACERFLLTQAGLLRTPKPVHAHIARLHQLGITSLSCSKSDLVAKGADKEEATKLKNWMRRVERQFRKFREDGTSSKQFDELREQLVAYNLLDCESEDQDVPDQHSLASFELVESLCDDQAPDALMDNDVENDVENVVAHAPVDIDEDEDIDDKIVAPHSEAVDMEADDFVVEQAHAVVCRCGDVRDIGCVYDRLFHDYDEFAPDLEPEVCRQVQRHFSLPQPAAYVRRRWIGSPCTLAADRRAVKPPREQ